MEAVGGQRRQVLLTFLLQGSTPPLPPGAAEDVERVLATLQAFRACRVSGLHMA